MKFTQPEWIKHTDDKSEKKPLVSICSLSPHPDGTRLVTGGLDAKIRVWSTDAISDPSLETDDSTKKLLFTGDKHAGPVLCVRFSNSGQYIASGAEDATVAIWTLEGVGSRKVWGSSDVNLEIWRVVTMPRGHESDVLSVAWSEDDKFLATGSVDTLVLIWDGATFAPLRKLAVHTGFIKGLIFDPTSRYLASQSSDDSLKIWDTSNWSLVADVTEPFQDAPNDSANWFLRPSWSPDGTFLITPNSMNGPVFVAGVVDRGGHWKSDTSFVGHQNIVTTAAFNPLFFHKDGNASQAAGDNVSSVLALAARSSISIWATAHSYPIMVIHDVFTRDIMDMQWSADGQNLWTCSSNGHVAVLSFDLSDFGPQTRPSLPGTKERFHLEKWNYVKPAVQIHQNNRQTQALAPIDQPLEPQKTTVMANGKKRIQPSFLGSLQGMQVQQPVFGATTGSAPVFPGTTTAADVTIVRKAPQAQAGPSSAAAFANANAAPAVSPSKRNALPPLPQRNEPDRLFASSALTRDSLPPNMDTDLGLRPPKHNRFVKGNTLGGSREREKKIVIEEIAPAYIPEASGSKDTKLAIPAIKSFLRYSTNDVVDVEVDEAAERLEIRNFGDGQHRPSEIALVGPTGPSDTEGKTLWLDYQEHKVVLGCWNGAFGAVSCRDGSMTIYSVAGRRMHAPLILDAPCSYLDAAGEFLMAITARGRVHLWNAMKMSACFAPLSLTDLLEPYEEDGIAPEIKNARVRPNGAPLISLDDGRVLTYDINLFCWTIVTSPWWSKGSELWEGRTRGKAAAANKGIVRIIEGTIHDMMVDDKHGGFVPDNVMDLDEQVTVEGEEQKRLGHEGDWRSAMSLGHLETRLAACELLDSSAEYKSQLLLYTSRLAAEGFRSKAEELIRVLMGPIYHKPNSQSTWKPTVCGMNKRDLLKDILASWTRVAAFKKLALDSQDLLRRLTDPV